MIEALRGLAALSVALFHFCNQLQSSGAKLITQYGWLGVDVFFVISGFVIPLSLYGRNYRLRDFPLYMLRRMIRLEPAYLVSIALVIVLWHASSMAPGFAGAAPSYSWQQIASHLFYIIPLTSYDWLNPVYWSLAYEFIFYITVGLTFSFLIQRNVALTVLLGAAALGIRYIAFGDLNVRIEEFLVGALLMRCTIGDAPIQTKAWVLGAVAISFLIGGPATGAVVAGAAAVIYFLRSTNLGRAALIAGSLSYSLYLIHVPIGGRVINLGKRFGSGAFSESIIVTLAPALSLAAAYVLRRLVEVAAIKASRSINVRTAPTTFK